MREIIRRTNIGKEQLTYGIKEHENDVGVDGRTAKSAVAEHVEYREQNIDLSRAKILERRNDDYGETNAIERKQLEKRSGKLLNSEDGWEISKTFSENETCNGFETSEIRQR